MQANRQIQNYQAFVLFKKRKTARASGLIRRTPAFFSAIFLVRLLHAPISRAVRRKTAAAAEIVRPSGDKVHRPPRARVKVRVERFALRVHGHQHALALRRALEDVLPVRQQHRAVGAMAQCPAARRAAASRAIYSVSPFFCGMSTAGRSAASPSSLPPSMPHSLP